MLTNTHITPKRKRKLDKHSARLFTQARAQRGNGTPLPLRSFARLCGVSHQTIATAEKDGMTDAALLRIAIKSPDVYMRDLAITCLRRRYPSLINPRPSGEKSWLEEKANEKETNVNKS